jgi:hypothetical protein
VNSAAGCKAFFCSAVGVQRKFSVRRSAFGGRRSAFGVQRSAFSVRRSAVGGRRSAVGGRRSAVGGRRKSIARRSQRGNGGIRYRRICFASILLVFGVQRLAGACWLLARAVRVAIKPVRQLLFLDEAADLGPQRGKHREKLVIWRINTAAEKFHHPDHVV